MGEETLKFIVIYSRIFSTSQNTDHHILCMKKKKKKMTRHGKYFGLYSLMLYLLNLTIRYSFIINMFDSNLISDCSLIQIKLYGVQKNEKTPTSSGQTKKKRMKSLILGIVRKLLFERKRLQQTLYQGE